MIWRDVHYVSLKRFQTFEFPVPVRSNSIHSNDACLCLMLLSSLVFAHISFLALDGVHCTIRWQGSVGDARRSVLNKIQETAVRAFY